MKKTVLCFVALLTAIHPCVNSYRESRVDFFNKILNAQTKEIVNSPYYKRVLTTLSCPDSDLIPKVLDAGKCFRDHASGKEVQIMHNGVKVYKGCYYGRKDPWMTNIIKGLSGHHEPQEERAFYEVLKHIPSNGVMVELGSYWAYYSLWFLNHNPGRKAILVEPAKGNLLKGKKNFELNNQKGDFILGFIGLDSKNPMLVKGKTPLVDLNSIFRSRSLEKVHMLHSDIQGFEYNMLKSIERKVKLKKIDWMFISTHSDEIHQKCLMFLKDMDMKIVCEHNCSESYSCDGLIVCKAIGVQGPDYIEISKNQKL